MVERFLSFRVRRFLMLVLVVMLTLGPMTRAYADDYEGGGGASQSFNSSFGTVWYGPTASGLYVRYGVVANTRYDAAVYCCRGRSFDLDDLSPKKKYKLINDADFNQFAQLFNASKPELTDDWSGDASIVMAWNSARQLYGETYCWNARYTNDQKIRAQEAIEDVLNDDDTPPSGGGSGGGAEEPGIKPADLAATATLWFSGNYTPPEDGPSTPYGDTTTLNLRTGDLDRIRTELNKAYMKNNNPCVFYTLYKNANIYEIGVFAVSQPYTIEDDSDGNIKKIIINSSSMPTVTRAHFNNSRYTYNQNDNTFTINYNTMTFSAMSVSGSSGNYYVNMSDTVYVSDATRTQGGGNDDEPTEPPIEWPTPPTETPQPPEVPTPGDPTQPTPPDPVDPTPGNPWIPIPDEDIAITGQDFQDLIDALNEHCIHLQNSIESNVSQLWDLQSDFLGTQFEDLFGLISDNFTWLGNDVITDSYNDLKSYLHELFEWLSEQLNFDVQVEGGQYDDTSVLYWLKQIWAKLPTGINTRPSDPVTNPDGWWDWLTQLLNNLAADLMALGHDRLAGVLETLNELRNKFPFSLPWDVAALLGLLVGNPVCPEFDMPCYAVSLEGLQEVGTYHLTLEPYETIWEGVKWIETLAFSVYLIMNTNGLMDMVSKTVRPR